MPKAIRDIVGVIPLPVKLAVAALAVVALLLGAAYWLSRARARRLARQREELLEDVGLLQAALLPKVADRLGGLPVSVAYRPAAGLAAGGDLYDAFELGDGGVAFIVGDVSGHGREALSRTTLVHYTLRAYLDAGLEPRQVLALTDRRSGGSSAACSRPWWSPSTSLRAERSPTRAPAILRRSCRGRSSMSPSPSFPRRRSASASCPRDVASRASGFRPDVRSVSTPDGLIEAHAGGELLGRDRLAEMMAGLGTENAAQSLIDAVHAEAGDASDDMAACLFATDGRAAGAGERLEELEVDAMTLGDRGLERFLEACGVSADKIPATISRAHEVAVDSETVVLRIAIDHGRAVAEVQSAAVPALAAA